MYGYNNYKERLMELLPFTFTCPLCCEHHYTFIDKRNYAKLLNRDTDLNEVFEGYPREYINIFTTGFCSTCQKSNFMYDVREDEDGDELRHRIEDLRLCTI